MSDQQARDHALAQNMLVHKLQPKISPVGSIASQRPLSQLSSHNVNKHSQNYGIPEPAPPMYGHFNKPLESSQSMHNLSKPPSVACAMPGANVASPDQNQNMKGAVSSGNLTIGAASASNSSNKSSAEQRLTHEQFRAALQMVVSWIYFHNTYAISAAFHAYEAGRKLFVTAKGVKSETS